MLVEAVITWKNGDVEKVHAGSFVELFKAIGDREIASVDAYKISTRDMRQGRVKACV